MKINNFGAVADVEWGRDAYTLVFINTLGERLALAIYDNLAEAEAQMHALDAALYATREVSE